MTRKPLACLLVGFFLATLCKSLSYGALRPTLSIRRLAIEADAIVIAVPLDPKPGEMPHRYRVVEVMQGTEYGVGDEVVLHQDALPELTPSKFAQSLRGGDKVAPPEIDKALLFIMPPVDGWPVVDGTVRADIRALAKTGEALLPQQVINPGAQFMLPLKGVTWEGMLVKVRAELPEVNHVRELRAIEDPAQRNRALLDWIRAHKGEFGGGFEGQTEGWATYEYKLFEWIYESCVPEDCWAAIELMVEIHGRPDSLSVPSFCSPEGRSLLLSKAFDEQLDDKLRLTALKKLSNSCFWPQREDFPSIVNATPDEQNEIIDRVTPLLKHQEPEWRSAAVRCLSEASWPGDGNLNHLGTKRAVPALTALYGVERDAHVREQLATALRLMGDEWTWQQTSGNPRGMVVIARVAEARADELVFQVNFMYTRTQRTLPPVAKFEQRDERGDVAISAGVTPIVKMTKDRAMREVSTWIERGELTLPVGDLQSGVWQVTFEGFTDENEPWHSEPIEVTLPVAK